MDVPGSQVESTAILANDFPERNLDCGGSHLVEHDREVRIIAKQKLTDEICLGNAHATDIGRTLFDRHIVVGIEVARRQKLAWLNAKGVKIRPNIGRTASLLEKVELPRILHIPVRSTICGGVHADRSGVRCIKFDLDGCGGSGRAISTKSEEG